MKTILLVFSALLFLAGCKKEEAVAIDKRDYFVGSYDVIYTLSTPGVTGSSDAGTGTLIITKSSKSGGLILNDSKTGTYTAYVGTGNFATISPYNFNLISDGKTTTYNVTGNLSFISSNYNGDLMASHNLDQSGKVQYILNFNCRRR